MKKNPTAWQSPAAVWQVKVTWNGRRRGRSIKMRVSPRCDVIWMSTRSPFFRLCELRKRREEGRGLGGRGTHARREPRTGTRVHAAAQARGHARPFTGLVCPGRGGRSS